jgi:RNA polymerase sigma-70 factor, ECF subfamily
MPMSRALQIVTPESEIDWIRRARAGDADAFEPLYRAHTSRVFAIALRLTGDRQHALDVMQDAFVRAWERIDSFRGESAFGTWLYRLTVNVALESRRSDVRRLRRVAPADPATLTLHAGRGDDPAARVDLERAIRELPEKARVVFVLHDIEGYNHAEIARLTGRAEGSVRAQLSRAREALRTMLGT